MAEENPYTYGDFDERPATDVGKPIPRSHVNRAYEKADYLKWVQDNAGIGAGSSIFQHSNEIAEDVTIAAGMNGLSAGPASLSAAVTVTLSAGSAWNVIGQLTFGDGAGITFGDGSALKML